MVVKNNETATRLSMVPDSQSPILQMRSPHCWHASGHEPKLSHHPQRLRWRVFFVNFHGQTLKNEHAVCQAHMPLKQIAHSKKRQIHLPTQVTGKKKKKNTAVVPDMLIGSTVSTLHKGSCSSPAVKHHHENRSNRAHHRLKPSK